MAETFNHEADSARGAGNLVAQAQGVINFQVKQIELTVHQLRTRGWEGEAANKFYAVATEMVAGARRLQGKMGEMAGNLEEVNRSFTVANETMSQSVNSIKYNIT